LNLQSSDYKAGVLTPQPPLGQTKEEELSTDVSYQYVRSHIMYYYIPVARKTSKQGGILNGDKLSKDVIKISVFFKLPHMY